MGWELRHVDGSIEAHDACACVWLPPDTTQALTAAEMREPAVAAAIARQFRALHAIDATEGGLDPRREPQLFPQVGNRAATTRRRGCPWQTLDFD